MNQIFDPNYSDSEDKTLIQEAIGGSRSALDTLVRRHFDFIYNVALRYVLSPDDAEDLTQDVLVKVITKLSQFRHDSDFRTWLYRIVFNHFLTMKKTKMENVVSNFDQYGAGLDSIPNQDLSIEEAFSLKEEVIDAKLSCMTGMLMCLSREQRLVYILGEFFEMDSSLGSEIFSISPENYRKQLSRARKDLYQFMNQKCGLINLDNPCRCPKKTKGFIEAGWVNQENLQFNNHFKQRIHELVHTKSNSCDTLMEEKYGSLFKDHPYYNKSSSKVKILEFTKDLEAKKIFDL
ncbi:MAG: RNA polymerase sigma factor [Leptospiraceae bacterium]|nr:RNA polymerase sigma factor [Leptospiraceae bacterium]MCZ8347406.1 RNA polymerase sigma factor [Leptospiraceae bacterium]